MTKHINIGIYLSNSANKNRIIKQIFANEFLTNDIDISNMKGVLHSTITINQLIEEELRHDKFVIQTAENISLKSMSSGQQKRALMMHLIEQNPEFIVLDDVYSNIDSATQTYFTELLDQLSKSTLLIQIFFRKRDILPCINRVYTVDENSKIVSNEDINDFKKSSFNIQHQGDGFVLPTEYSKNMLNIQSLIEMNSVSINYGSKKVLNNINWTIQSGEFWQLKGLNGSGKSTILSLITGDNPKAYGQDIVLFGRKKGSGETIWEIKKQIGYFTPSMVEQFTHNDTVENMILSGLVDSVGLYTQPTDMQKDIAKSWARLLGKTYKNKMFQSLSIGQQRMVMVARAMVKHPPLLILDEPTIELDDVNSDLFINMVNAIALERKIAILYVSHREENGLRPDKIFELIPDIEGSTGIVKDCNWE